jgi:hypothetical protein
MRLAVGVVAAIGLLATALPLSAADERNGWYIYWGDNVILGGPYPSEDVCKTAMKDRRHVSPSAVCVVIVYRNGTPVSGTQDDLERPPLKTQN